MAKVILITGGQRSGKSNFAQRMALEHSDNPVYLATSRIWDDDFKKRVERHKDGRSEKWINLEEEKAISKLELNGKTVVLDCITLWLTNYFSDNNYDVDTSLELAKKEWNKFIEGDFIAIVVTNEIGMGVHAQSQGARKFTDLQGWMNQYIAQKADEAYLMVSGIPVKIK